MRTRLGFFLILLILGAWLYYSSPGKRSFSEADYLGAPQIHFTQMWENANLQNQPVWVEGEVSGSFSTKMGGIFVLRNEKSDLFVLARGITPRTLRQVRVLLIPREVIMIQDQEYLVGALVRYQYLDEEKPAGTFSHNPFSFNLKSASYVTL